MFVGIPLMNKIKEKRLIEKSSLEDLIKRGLHKEVYLKALEKRNEIDHYLGFYLKSCEEHNSYLCCIAILDSITKGNTTEIHDLSKVEFHFIIEKWVADNNFHMLYKLIDKKYYIKIFNTSILNFIAMKSIRQNNKKIFDYCMKNLENFSELKEMISLMIVEDNDMLEHFFKNNEKFVSKYKSFFKNEKRFQKLLLQQKIFEF